MKMIMYDMTIPPDVCPEVIGGIVDMWGDFILNEHGCGENETTAAAVICETHREVFEERMTYEDVSFDEIVERVRGEHASS
jgi:hypothetical protein